MGVSPATASLQQIPGRRGARRVVVGTIAISHLRNGVAHIRMFGAFRGAASVAAVDAANRHSYARHDPCLESGRPTTVLVNDRGRAGKPNGRAAGATRPR